MEFSIELISWYKKNKRDLPWRETNDPYTIWLSEIILQQTRVNQGLSYFHKFIENYPKVENLAHAKEDEVLKLWQGLGYYSRARNLHAAAKSVVNDYNGIFPKTFNEILSLKGVGEYTASAIASFSYNLPYPVIDGNVYRVLSRIYGVKDAIDTGSGKKIFKQLAEELIDLKNAGIYNQSIMEFGALHCTPKQPKCESCPFKLECYALKNNVINELPRKEKKLKQKERFFNYLIIKDDSSVLIKKREQQDIWKGLYDFPLIESITALNKQSILDQIRNLVSPSKFTVINSSPSIKHLLSHQKILATFWLIEVPLLTIYEKDFIKIELKEINNYPVPKLIENYIKTIL